MAIAHTKNVIVITERKEVLDPVEIALKRLDLAAVKTYMNLFSLSIIRKQAANAKSLAFIANELYRFVKEQGLPSAFILDGRIDSGIGPHSDPEGIMLFKTLLLSCMVLAKGRGLEKFRGNFLLLARADDEQRIKNITHSPMSLLKSTISPDKALNALIEEYRSNIHLFGTKFYIEYTRADAPAGDLLAGVEKFFAEIKNRDTLVKLKTEGTAVDSVSTEPGVVLFKSGDGRLFADGTQVAAYPKKSGEIKAGEFYVVGNWTSRTQLEVSQKIAMMVIKGIQGVDEFGKDDRIVINLDRNTHIDASIATSLAALVSIELKEFKKILVMVNKENGFTLRNSPGYSLVMKQVRVSSEE